MFPAEASLPRPEWEISLRPDGHGSVLVPARNSNLRERVYESAEGRGGALDTGSLGR
jgi:hypothetical protein